MPLIALSLAQLPMLALEHLRPLEHLLFPDWERISRFETIICKSVQLLFDFGGALLATAQSSKT